MSLLDRALAQINQCLEIVEQSIAEVQVPRHGVVGRVALGLLVAVLERAEIIVAALKAEGVSSAFLLVRSQLELTVDLVNLEKDAAYLDVLRKKDLLTKKRFLEYATEAGAEQTIFRRLANDPDLSSNLQKVNSEIRTLEPRTGNELSTKLKARFEKAGMEEDYKGKYTYFSTYAHGEASAIFDAYFEQENMDLYFIKKKRPAESDLAMIVDTAAFCLARSIHSVNVISDGSIAAQAAAARRAWKQLSELWKEIGKEDEDVQT